MSKIKAQMKKTSHEGKKKEKKPPKDSFIQVEGEFGKLQCVCGKVDGTV